MKNFLVFTLGLTLCIVSAHSTARAMETLKATTPLMAEGVRSVHELALDDGTKGFIGADHKLYLLGASGKYAPAKAGHYMLAQGGCVTVASDAAIDPASFARLTSMR